MLVLDDLMEKVGHDKRVFNLFIEESVCSTYARICSRLDDSLKPFHRTPITALPSRIHATRQDNVPCSCKRFRGDNSAGDDHAGDDFTQGPLQNLLTQLVQRPKKTPRRSSTTSAIKTKTTPLRPLIPPKPRKRFSGWHERAFAEDPLMGETTAEIVTSLSKRVRCSAKKNPKRKNLSDLQVG